MLKVVLNKPWPNFVEKNGYLVSRIGKLRSDIPTTQIFDWFK